MNLADPELELIDPTPNIHNLFVHFDELFFWTKLMGRAIVRWSKKMYSCAGICSYEGRNGLCDIALSEPLLKLRPRKDLVETLLHEMIHAFLFITNRDSDRDGHGPNFQAHMHRINRAAGLNISIYHDFHDEVKLYLRHWWRCNGRCQTMKPYFGIVKRSCNKAPGPKEYWWSQHQKMCGGTFIKIKEPEKVQKPKKTVKAKAKGDITKFINNNTGNAVNKNITTNKNVKNENKTKNIATVEPKSKADDIKKLIDLGRQRTNSLSVIENVRNIWAAKQLQSQPVENTVAETLRHVWTTKQLPTVPGASTKKNTATNWKKNKSHTVQIDSPPKKVMKIDDYFKYKASTILQQVYGQEFIISQSSNSPTLKAIPKADSVTIPPVNVFVNCPNCNNQVYSNDINIHLDECLNKEIIEELSKDFTDPSTVKKEINEKDNKNGLKTIVGTIQAIPYKFIPDIKPKIENLERIIKTQSIDWNTKLNTATSAHHGHVKPSTSKEGIIQKCPGCGIKIDIPLEEHLKECFRFFELNSTIPKEGISDLETVVIHDEFNPLKVKSEPGTSKPEEVQKCPICGIKIEKPIEEHLDECLSIFDNDTTIPTEGASIIETIVIDDDEEDDIFDETQTFNATGTKSPCPCCLKMIEVAEMNAHLNDCLSA